MVSAEIGACRDSGRRRNFKGLRPNLEVESVAVEFGGKGWNRPNLECTGVWGSSRVRGVTLEVTGFRPNLQIQSVSAELFACLRPNLAVESVAVEYGGNGGIGGIWSLQGFGGSA